MYYRYRRKKGDSGTKQQNGHNMREFDNDTYTNHYADIGKIFYNTKDFYIYYHLNFRTNTLKKSLMIPKG